MGRTKKVKGDPLEQAAEQAIGRAKARAKAREVKAPEAAPAPVVAEKATRTQDGATYKFQVDLPAEYKAKWQVLRQARGMKSPDLLMDLVNSAKTTKRGK